MKSKTLKVKELIDLLQDIIDKDPRNAEKYIYYNEDRMNGEYDNRNLKEVFIRGEQVWIM